MKKYYNYSGRFAASAAAVFLMMASEGDAKHAKNAEQNKTASSEFHLPQHPNIGGLLPTVLRYGDTFDPLEGVLAYDMQDGYLEKITVSGNIDTRKPGSKHLTYSVRNSRGDTKTIQRKIFVLPRNTFAYIFATARRGSQKVIPLNSSYLNKLTDGITYIKPVVYAVPETEYSFKLIERDWKSPSYTTKPPTAAEWEKAPDEKFYRDLYLCMRPQLDRWLKITLKNGNETKTQVYGLKGDPGVIFHSDYQNKDILRLSREVDDPATAEEQFSIYSQSASYWCPLPMPLEKMMGGKARITTIGNLSKAYPAANKEELHGFYTTIRAFMSGIDKRSQSSKNWNKIGIQWDHAFGQALNTSYRRSYQIPISEMNGGSSEDFINHFTEYYRHMRQTFDPKRIIVGTGLRGHTTVFANFYDAESPYFKAEWHKGHFSSMYQRFASEDKALPFIIMYPRINETWSKYEAFRQLEIHRRIHKFAQKHNVEAAIMDKIGIMGRYPDGEWSTFALPYYAMWYCYNGYDYLNNGPFFADDWDGDGLSNADEHALNTNPFLPDTDGDLIFDGLEKKYGLNPRDPTDAAKDFDHDRMSNFAEIIAASKTPGAGCGTPQHPPLTIKAKNGKIQTIAPDNPADAAWDPDLDLLPAWFEVNAGLNPSDISLLKNGNKFFIEQPDVSRPFAGMIANFAYHYNLDKNLTDFDGDGISNMDELQSGSDPAFPEKSQDPRRKQWAKLGAELFTKYFHPEQYKKMMNSKENHIDSVFSYSTTENAITAEVSIRALDCDAVTTDCTPDKIEYLTASMMMLLEELRQHPELWQDQQKIIAGVSVRTYLKRQHAKPLRQDRGLYSIYIPIKVFKSTCFREELFNTLNSFSAIPAKFKKRKGAKGDISRKFLAADNGIKILFYDSLEKDYLRTFKKASKKKQLFLGENFDYKMFLNEYTTQRTKAGHK